MYPLAEVRWHGNASSGYVCCKSSSCYSCCSAIKNKISMIRTCISKFRENITNIIKLCTMYKPLRCMWSHQRQLGVYCRAWFPSPTPQSEPDHLPGKCSQLSPAKIYNESNKHIISNWLYLNFLFDEYLKMDLNIYYYLLYKSYLSWMSG